MLHIGLSNLASSSEVSCAFLEGRANVLDRPASNGRARPNCAALAETACTSFYESDAAREYYRPCKREGGESGGRCKAAGAAPGVPCGVAAQLPRLRGLRAELEQLAQLLRARGLPSAREAATIALAETFERAIEADSAAPPALFEAAYRVLLQRASPEGWADGAAGTRELAAQLPYDEMGGLEAVLRAALRRARAAQAAGPISTAAGGDGASGAPVSLLAAEISGGYFRRGGGAGAPLLGGGFNAVGKLFADADGSSAAAAAEWAARLRALGASLMAVNVYLHELRPAGGEGGGPHAGEPALPEATVERLRRQLAWAEAHGVGVVLHVGHDLPAWAAEAHPELAGARARNSSAAGGGGGGGGGGGAVATTTDTYGDQRSATLQQHGVAYDIDHPLGARLLAAMLGGTARRLGCPRALVAWELANEPAFRVSASAHTLAAFAAWLAAAYASPDALRRRWGPRAPPAAAAGDEARFFAAAAEAAAPTSVDPRRAERLAGGAGAAMWADWSRFNARRVTAWAERMVGALRGAGRCHRSMMKLNNALAFSLRPADHGIDRPALGRLLDLSAYDSNFGYATADGVSRSFDHPPARYDTREYCVDWLNQAASLALARAAAPGRPLLDSEFHVVSATKWRRRVASDAAARAVRLKVVLAALLGQAASLLWLWGRGPRGEALGAACASAGALADAEGECMRQARWLALSPLAQPRALDAYAGAGVALRAAAAEVERLAAQRPRVWLYYSEPSARMGAAQARATLATVEALAFLGLPWGFLLEESLLDTPADPPAEQTAWAAPLLGEGDWLLLPGATHVAAAALAALAARAAHPLRGRRMLALGATPAEAEAVLGCDPWGDAWGDAARGATARLPRLSLDGLPRAALLHRLEAIVLADASGGKPAAPGAPEAATPPRRLVHCVDAEPQRGGATADGVYCRAARGAGGDGGAIVAFVANLRARPARVWLRLAPGGPALNASHAAVELLERRPLQLGEDGVLTLATADALLLQFAVPAAA